jgi:predicted GNAT family acetyltransferase
VKVEYTDDPQAAWAGAETYLLSDPIGHNVILTLLQQRMRVATPGNYWTVRDGDTVVGFAFQSPTTYNPSLTPMSRAAVESLAHSIAAQGTDLPGVLGQAAPASAFAAQWAEERNVAVVPAEAGRIYELTTVTMPPQPPGTVRLATVDERDRLVPWARGFAGDTDDTPAEDPVATLDRHLESGRLFVWDDGEPRAMTVAVTPVAGVCRIGFVYTPPESRGRGYASAIVALLSQQMLDTEADRCMLYTQMQNPTSNKIYRTIGYRPVGDVIRYRFG